MEFRHGGLVLDVPADWKDQSTILLIRPPEDLSMPSAANSVQSTEAISITFQIGETDPKKALQAQAEQLRSVDPDHQVLKEGPFHCGLGDGWLSEQRMTLQGNEVQQCVVACPAGGVMIIATAAASPERFPRHLAELLSILRSMRAART